MAWLAPSVHRDAVLGDAAEEMCARAERDGRRAARRWYRRQVLRSVAPGLRAKVGRSPADRHGPEREREAGAMWTHEVRTAARGLARRPGFAATVTATLAVGLGVTTSLFGVFRAVFLDPIDLPRSHELVVVMQESGFGCCGPSSGPDYLDWVDRERSFEGMAALSPGRMALTGLEEPERVYATRVTASAFAFLHVEPLLGRSLVPEDQVSADVVVVGHRLWQRLWDASPEAVGATLEVDGSTYTVVGVMPDGFDVPSPWAVTSAHELYLPFADADLRGSRGSHSYPVIARLSEGTTVEDAQADMARIMRELAVEYPSTNENRTARVFTVHEYLYGSTGRQLMLLLAAAGLVLLIACGNVAGLQLARAVGRESEFAVRTALGASRRAVARLLFAESVVLAAAGGVVGIAAAYAGVEALRSLLPATFPTAGEVRVDGLVLGFGLLAAAVTAVLFGTVPALLVSRTDLAARVREGGYSTLAPRKERARDAFIMAQIAAGLVLANGAGLLVRSYAEVRGQEYGFVTDGVVTMSVEPAGPVYADRGARERYLERVLEAAAGVPGVSSVGLVSRLPLEGGTNGRVQVDGWAPRANENEGPLVEVATAMGDYFSTLEIPLLRGRLLVGADSTSAMRGVLVNQAMVDEVWPDEDPVGKRFGFGSPPPWLTVVGVVGDTRQWGPEQPVVAQAYVPYAAAWTTGGFLTARISGDPERVFGDLRSAVLNVDRTLPPGDVVALEDRFDGRLAQRRFYTTLFGVFALAALFLAAAGIYGTVSYFVARRVRDLGVRLALGAGETGIVALVLRRGLRLATYGILLGTLGAWASARVLESLLYRVAPVSPGPLLGGCMALAGVTLAASLVPAVRAVRLPPVLALRAE